jgi:hypothetical protein
MFDRDEPTEKDDIPKSEAYTVVINHPTTINPDQNAYNRIINTRWLKRLLRYRIPHVFSSEHLHPHLEWPEEELGQSLNSLGKSIWSIEELQRAATQIIGRVWRRPGFGLGDIGVVLHRMGLCVAHGHDSKGEVDQTETEPWNTRIQRIKKRCNKHERGLIRSVIDPGKLFHLVSLPPPPPRPVLFVKPF